MRSRISTAEWRENRHRSNQFDPLERELTKAINESISELSNSYDEILKRHKEASQQGQAL